VSTRSLPNNSFHVNARPGLASESTIARMLAGSEVHLHMQNGQLETMHRRSEHPCSGRIVNIGIVQRMQLCFVVVAGLASLVNLSWYYLYSTSRSYHLCEVDSPTPSGGSDFYGLATLVNVGSNLQHWIRIARCKIMYAQQQS
jgi:hypothetical protein